MSIISFFPSFEADSECTEKLPWKIKAGRLGSYGMNVVAKIFPNASLSAIESNNVFPTAIIVSAYYTPPSLQAGSTAERDMKLQTVMNVALLIIPNSPRSHHLNHELRGAA